MTDFGLMCLMVPTFSVLAFCLGMAWREDNPKGEK